MAATFFREKQENNPGITDSLLGNVPEEKIPVSTSSRNYQADKFKPTVIKPFQSFDATVLLEHQSQSPDRRNPAIQSFPGNTMNETIERNIYRFQVNRRVCMRIDYN